MTRIARNLIVASVVFVLVLPVGGCSNSSMNEESMKGTQGTAGANPPTSQKEFYEQQQAAKSAAAKPKSKRN